MSGPSSWPSLAIRRSSRRRALPRLDDGVVVAGDGDRRRAAAGALVADPVAVALDRDRADLVDGGAVAVAVDREGGDRRGGQGDAVALDADPVAGAAEGVAAAAGLGL